ncbi:efflux RND transporter periplasmic adaptor subunit [Vibrio methylphosphonaticus]|uniref:efflux RND transporter periplasmic adaptor subunit n=1 Tax=Vibrio methylphosphonaticus TaxID=2946866 RepID=UPI00202A91A4|nr:efflux RND transporter periplasmic adaptor subunit [Vibrio methylphosphonaticus]MCL9774148.1 efflux RND transporter periplasmic adaptor subunit [Vibrio methylphosphonaticus]
MLKRSLKWIVPIFIVGIAAVGYGIVQKTKPEIEQQKPLKLKATVKTQVLTSTPHQILISSFGEVVPLEQTALATQVSGEVVSWHPSFVAGGVVKRGEVLFTIEKDNYEAAVLQAEAELAQSQASLIEERAKAKVAQQQAKNIANTQVSDLYLRIPQVLSAEARVKSAQAGLRRAKRDLDNCEIEAPYDALVVSRSIGVGQYITAGSQVAEINNIETAEIMVPIAGFDAPFLPHNIIGTQANVIAKGRTEATREGMIVRDLGVVDSATRMVSMVIRVEDPYGLKSAAAPLPFGSYVEVRFFGKTVADLYVIPQELVSDDRVWLVDPDDRLIPKPVHVLREEKANFYIDSGLENGDVLVLTVPEFPQVGMQVKRVVNDDGDGGAQ